MEAPGTFSSRHYWDSSSAMKDHFLKESLIGEEWMALRQIAFGAEPAQIPRSVRTRLEALGLIARGDYGLMLTETGRRMMETPD
jgi:ribosomal protein S19E (S16A)